MDVGNMFENSKELDGLRKEQEDFFIASIRLRYPPEEEETGSETSSICDNFALVDFAKSEIPCQPGNCGSPPISSHTVKSRSNSELWSSMPEANLTGRLLAGEVNARSDLCRVSASFCYRSLSSSLSNCQQPFNSTTLVIRSSKNSSICLRQPHPSQVKSNTGTKRGRNVTSNAEDVHSLRLLQKHSKGVLKVNQNIEAHPSIAVKDESGNIKCTPIYSRIVLLYAEQNELQFDVPGGLIGVDTTMDPTLTHAGRLVGQVLGEVGSLPDVFVELEILEEVMLDIKC